TGTMIGFGSASFGGVGFDSLGGTGSTSFGMSFGGGTTSGSDDPSGTGGGGFRLTFGGPAPSRRGGPRRPPRQNAARGWAGGRGAGRSRTLSPACRAAKWSAARSAIAAGSGPSPIVMLLYGRMVPFARWNPAIAML